MGRCSFPLGRKQTCLDFQFGGEGPFVLLQFCCLRLLVVPFSLEFQDTHVQSFLLLIFGSSLEPVGSLCSWHFVGTYCRKWSKKPLFYHSFPDLGNSLHAPVVAVHDLPDSFWPGPFWWKPRFCGRAGTAANDGSHPGNSKGEENTSCDAFRPGIFGLIFQYVININIFCVFLNEVLFCILFKPIFLCLICKELFRTSGCSVCCLLFSSQVRLELISPGVVKYFIWGEPLPLNMLEVFNTWKC